MKIGVYAIACNESKNVRPWLEACGEADVICVTDTGSTDDTPNLLLEGSTVLSYYTEPFRFDKARNFALEQAKACNVDVWVSLDLDEYPEKGWRKKLEAAVTANTSAQGWRITIDNGSYSFQNIRAHRPEGWKWQHACHEVLIGPGPVGDAGFKVVHHQDRSKPRNYLPLLELDAEENPKDGRAWHYLGREYMYLGRWEKAIEALTNALAYDKWHEQLAVTLIYLSRCFWHKGNMQAARDYAWEAIMIWGSREAWVHLTWLLDQEGDPTAAIAAENALKIKKHGLYPSEPSAWSRETENWLRKLAEA